jgi:hypothetical protein
MACLITRSACFINESSSFSLLSSLFLFPACSYMHESTNKGLKKGTGIWNQKAKSRPFELESENSARRIGNRK